MYVCMEYLYKLVNAIMKLRETMSCAVTYLLASIRLMCQQSSVNQNFNKIFVLPVIESMCKCLLLLKSVAHLK